MLNNWWRFTNLIRHVDVSHTEVNPPINVACEGCTSISGLIPCRSVVEAANPSRNCLYSIDLCWVIPGLNKWELYPQTTTVRDAPECWDQRRDADEMYPHQMQLSYAKKLVMEVFDKFWGDLSNTSTSSKSVIWEFTSTSFRGRNSGFE